jgi:hypothetical protein
LGLRHGRLADDRLRLLLRVAHQPFAVLRDRAGAADLLGERGAQFLDQLEQLLLADDTVSQRQHGPRFDGRFELVDHTVDGHQTS